MESQGLRVSVGEFIVLMNQTLEYAYPSVEIEGEVSGFKEMCIRDRGIIAVCRYDLG